MKTSELEGSKLDEMVYRVTGDNYSSEYMAENDLSPSTNWQQCGELIEEYHINLQWYFPRNDNDYRYEAWVAWSADGASTVEGAIPLVAVCRCIVASKYGEDVPDD